MISGIDLTLLRSGDAPTRQRYVQDLIAACQQRQRDITPDLAHVIEAFRGETIPEARAALMLLIVQSRPDDLAFQFCQSLRKSEDEYIRERSVWFLTRHDPKTTPDLYREQGTDPSWKVRFWIGAALVGYDRQAAVDLFLSVWEDPQVGPDWKEGIENDVSLLGDVTVIPRLRRMSKTFGSEALLSVIWRIERRLAVEYLEAPNAGADTYTVNSISCPSCRRALTVDSRYMGKKARCRDCGGEFVVPLW